MFPRVIPSIGVPLRYSRASLGRFPRFQHYYEDTKTASVLLLPLLLGSDTSVGLSCSLLETADSSSLALAFVRPGSATPAFFPRKQEALPASQESLHCFALLYDPGQSHTPDL